MGKTVKRRVLHKKRKNKTLKVYNQKEFKSKDGMLTSIWGPPTWHLLHTISFNYPNEPTSADKDNYKSFILKLGKVLPCKFCRDNFCKNIKSKPLNNAALKNRHSFSKWVYNFHEHINKMLGKKSGLTYNKIRERYEHFRSRCTKTNKLFRRKTRKKEKGCTEPLLIGKSAQCVLKIVPKDSRVNTFQIDKKCIKKKIKTP
jgi:hypothetical protein